MEEMYFIMGAIMIGFLGLVVGFIILSVFLRRFQKLTGSNTQAIFSLKEAIQKMGEVHHEIENNLCVEFDNKYTAMTAKTEAKFEFLKREHCKTKNEIIGVINSGFKEFADTFGKRLTRLEYEVAEIKKEISNE